MNYLQIVQQIAEKRSFLIVGLDSDYDKIPECVKAQAAKESGDVWNPIKMFNQAVIDATAPYAVGYKLNSAFYEKFGMQGIGALYNTVGYIKDRYPEMLVIVDAKRGDIGNTSECYATAVFDNLNADAVTVAPYMGYDSVEPFLKHEGKWTILLALTSNKGSDDFQMKLLGMDEGYMFERVLRIASSWQPLPDHINAEQMMFVVGATHPKMFQDVRRIVPDHFLLVPGVGAQGGSLRSVVAYGINENFCCLLVNSSRGIIFAGKDVHYAEAAGNKARELQQEMSELLSEYTRM